MSYITSPLKLICFLDLQLLVLLQLLLWLTNCLTKGLNSTCMFGLARLYPCHCHGKNKPREADWSQDEGERYLEESQTTLAETSPVLVVPDNPQMYESAELLSWARPRSATDQHKSLKNKWYPLTLGYLFCSTCF